MFSILDRYIGKIIFHSIMMVLFALVSLSSIIKFVEQLRKVGQGNYSSWAAGFFTFLVIPKDIEVFFPTAALLGTLIGLGSLAVNNELLAMQSSGLNQFQFASSVMKTAIPLAMLMISITEWIVPPIQQAAYSYRTQAIHGDSIFSNQNGLWIKDGNDFIFIEHVADNKKLFGIYFYDFYKSERLQFLRYAEKATFNNGNWILSQISELNFTNDKQITYRQILNSKWYTKITPERLSTVVLEPHALSISQLYQHSMYLKKNAQKSSRYQLIMWKKIFSPVAVTVMMLMALSFIFGPLYNVTMGIRILAGISFGFMFYMLDNIFGSLSLIYNIHPFFGACLPSIIFFAVSIILVVKYRS